jgi:hypothetical protein
MATILFTVNVPNVDGSSNNVDDSTINSSMESIALDSTTRLNGPISYTSGGSFEGQTNEHMWLIADTNLSTAESTYSTFNGSYTWGAVTPNYRAVTLTAHG